MHEAPEWLRRAFDEEPPKQDSDGSEFVHSLADEDVHSALAGFESKPSEVQAEILRHLLVREDVRRVALLVPLCARVPNDVATELLENGAYAVLLHNLTKLSTECRVAAVGVALDSYYQQGLAGPPMEVVRNWQLMGEDARSYALNRLLTMGLFSLVCDNVRLIGGGSILKTYSLVLEQGGWRELISSVGRELSYSEQVILLRRLCALGYREAVVVNADALAKRMDMDPSEIKNIADSSS